MINEKRAHKYCRDDLSKIENYEKAIADTTQTWVIHHKLELTLDGEFALNAAQLKMHDMYYHRPYYELIFLTPSEHRRLHMKGEKNPFYGKHLSEEHRRKMSESHKGEKNPFYGKHHTEDNRRKMSESHKGKHHTDDTRKKMSESHKGKKFSEETRKKMSEAHKGKKRAPFSEEHRRKISESHKRKKF